MRTKVIGRFSKICGPLTVIQELFDLRTLSPFLSIFSEAVSRHSTGI